MIKISNNVMNKNLKILIILKDLRYSYDVRGFLDMLK